MDAPKRIKERKKHIPSFCMDQDKQHTLKISASKHGGFFVNSGNREKERKKERDDNFFIFLFFYFYFLLLLFLHDIVFIVIILLLGLVALANQQSRVETPVCQCFRPH